MSRVVYLMAGPDRAWSAPQRRLRAVICRIRGHKPLRLVGDYFLHNAEACTRCLACRKI